MTFTMDDARTISDEALKEFNNDPALIIKNDCSLFEIEDRTLFNMYEETLISGAFISDSTPENVKFRRILNEKLNKWRKEIG